MTLWSKNLGIGNNSIEIVYENQKDHTQKKYLVNLPNANEEGKIIFEEDEEGYTSPGYKKDGELTSSPNETPNNESSHLVEEEVINLDVDEYIIEDKSKTKNNQQEENVETNKPQELKKDPSESNENPPKEDSDKKVDEDNEVAQKEIKDEKDNK